MTTQSQIRQIIGGRLTCLMTVLLLAACGGSGSGGGGTTTPPSPPPPPAPTINTYNVDLTAADVVAGSDATGAASAVVRYNVTDAEIDVAVTLSNVVAQSASLRRGFAGSTGEEIYALSEDAANSSWKLEPQPLSDNDIADLVSGAWYLIITTSAEPQGAYRGQISPTGVSIARFEMMAEQVTSNSDSTAHGTAWLTFDEANSLITAHLAVTDLADAESAALRRALAGNNGTLLTALSQDTLDPNHWFTEAAELTSDVRAASAAGELYVLLTSPDFPDGAIRGQYLPDDMELVVTELTGEAVVPDNAGSSANEVSGRLMSTLSDTGLTAILNLFSVPDATAVELRQAPAGLNGPLIATFSEDIDDARHWTLMDMPIGASVEASLRNRSLYVSVSTPMAPDGVARGQIKPQASTQPPDPASFTVISVDPQNDTTLEALPQTAFATLDREPLPASVTPHAVTIAASGMDGSFGDGNETTITPSAVTAVGNTIEIDLAGVSAADDVYRVAIVGGGPQGIVDMSGIPLDGDGDGQPGGSYAWAFEVVSPPVSATLSKIQDEIFTPTCATAGCHVGNNAPDGLRLNTGAAWSNIVNVDSVQMPSLKRVSPGDPDNSYLVRKVQGSGIVANRMPLGGAPLSQEQIELIRQWVSAGALDN